LQGPVIKAHFIDVGQANATLLKFQCGVVLIDAGADQEHEEALVEFLNRFFDDRPAFDRTIKLVLPSPLPLSPRRVAGISGTNGVQCSSAGLASESRFGSLP